MGDRARTDADTNDLSDAGSSPQEASRSRTWNHSDAHRNANGEADAHADLPTAYGHANREADTHAYVPTAYGNTNSESDAEL